ncbi:MAG TPA: hypothetical protein VIM61_02680 [Chthoniobacterales bacterium]|jgi:hypothetical protein
MSPFRFVSAGVCATFLLTSAATAQLQDEAPPDAEALRGQIEALAQARKQRKFAYFQKAMGEVSAVIRNPGMAGNYIIDCMRNVQYEGKNGGNADFADWKKKNRNLLSDHDFEEAAKLHLRYLAITLKRAMSDSAESVQQDLWDYLGALGQEKSLLADVVKDRQKLKFSIFDPKEQKITGEMIGDMQNMQLASATNVRGYVQDLLNGGVNSGLAAQSLKLNGHLEGIPNWEWSAGNVSGILDQDIRTFLREKKDQRLISTWDYEISFRGEVVALKKDEEEKEKYWRMDVPRLLRKKADDVELLGFPNRALSMRLDLVKKYPEHPDFETWAGKVEEQVKAMEKSAPEASPAPASSDKPGAVEFTPAS